MLRRSLRRGWVCSKMSQHRHVSIYSDVGHERKVGEGELRLDETEEAVLDVLTRAGARSDPVVTVRVAGGWVRDKLLGGSNHDIDVALDTCTGHVFAERVNALLEEEGREAHRIAVIHANPEQSKHLETATVSVLGVPVDMVNLRTEEYASESRIPVARFGTAEEDALRRDFTINALFYNATAGVVEDLTGRGWDDLRARVLRTPLAPLETLRDDPLRLLRAVRFSARFGFPLEDELLKAARASVVRRDLATKVSRERVGTEIEGALGGKRPFAGALQIVELDLVQDVFGVPPKVWNSEKEAFEVLEAIKARDPASEPIADLCSKGPIYFSEREDFEGGKGFEGGDDFEGVEDFKRDGNPSKSSSTPSKSSSAPSESSFMVHKLRRLFVDVRRSADGSMDIDEEEKGGGSVVELWDPWMGVDWTWAMLDGEVFEADGSVELDEECVRSMLYAGLLFEYRDKVTLGLSGRGRTLRMVSVADELLKVSLKRKVKTCQDVSLLLQAQLPLESGLAHSLASQDFSDEIVQQAGEWMDSIKALWRPALYLHAAHVNDLPLARAVVQSLHRLQLADMWTQKPLLNGGDLIRAGIPRGPAMKEAMDAVRVWRYTHPQATTDDANRFLQSYVQQQKF